LVLHAHVHIHIRLVTSQLRSINMQNQQSYRPTVCHTCVECLANVPGPREQWTHRDNDTVGFSNCKQTSHGVRFLSYFHVHCNTSRIYTAPRNL